MPNPPPLGAIAAGIRYQVRFFWRMALPMLMPVPRVAKVVMEHRGIDAVDDVVVYYASPGENDRGRRISLDLHQLKFHVAQSGYVDEDVLVDPAWAGTKSPMLSRLAGAWKQTVASHPNARLKLVTNWPWRHDSPIAKHIRDGGSLSDEFLSASSRTKIGKVRSSWKTACSLSDGDFLAFLRSVRFATSAVSQDDAEQWLDALCQAAGLVPARAGVDYSAYDDLGKRLIESGRTEHTPESLRELVEAERLLAQKDQPFSSTFAVRSFTRFVPPVETEAACVVDMADLFDGRRPLQAETWSTDVPARLEAALPSVEALRQPVQVAIDAHLSIAWYVGHLLDPKAGIRVAIRQKTRGKGVEVWDVSCSRQPAGAPAWELATGVENELATDLAVVVSVTHDALEDAARHVRATLPAVREIVHARLPQQGHQAIVDGPHACWLADELVRLLAPKVAELRPPHVHVFPACPASLAFLLGQGGRALGPTTIYEYQFGEASRAYAPGMSTNKESAR